MRVCMCFIRCMCIYLMEGLHRNEQGYIYRGECMCLSLQADRDPEGPVDRERARTDAQVFNKTSFRRTQQGSPLYVCYRGKYFSKALISPIGQYIINHCMCICAVAIP